MNDLEFPLIEKAWGRKREILTAADLIIDRFYADPMRRCSVHRHSRMSNRFVVTDGILVIEMFAVRPWVGGSLPTARMRIPPGKHYDVPAGVWHRFVTEESPVRCWEVYRPDGPEMWDLATGQARRISRADIMRIDEGGHWHPAMSLRPEE